MLIVNSNHVEKIQKQIKLLHQIIQLKINQQYFR